MLKGLSIKKADIILFIVLLALGLGSTFLIKTDAGENAQVEITVDGQVYMTADLSKKQTLEIETQYGKNTVVIEDGRVYVRDADCSGQDCTRFNPISMGGESIMCLPHRLVITIVKGGGIDATSY